MLHELNSLFESDTIKPSYLHAHIILALYIFNDHKEGLGRYKLKNELILGAGTVRTLITRLNEKTNFIQVKSDKNKRKGHVLTGEGKKFIKRLKEKIPILEKGDTEILQKILIDSEENESFFCLVKNVAKKIVTGIEQRDAAIKIGGLGATCLIYNGNTLVFPPESAESSNNQQLHVDEEIVQYFQSKLHSHGISLEKNDVIVVGVASGDFKKARLATLNAALTLI
ncbi:MAG: DUF4443 domain-containing protein [Promethearchaeota archaeon]